jgi:hypothetical protein
MTCPELGETRWRYDHHILGFLLHHAEVINQLPGNPLLITLDLYALESSDAPLARA